MITSDIVNFITGWEDGAITDEAEVAAGFQLLINSGVVWHLQGMYGRTAQQLIDAGLCTPPQVNNPACPSGQCGLD